MPWLIPPWFFHEVGVLWAAGMPGSLCSKPGRICVGSQLGSDHSCLPAQAIIQGEQALSSYRASTTPQTCLLLLVPVLLQERQFITQVNHMTSWSSAPQKLMATVLREKGRHEEAGAEIFLHRSSWIQCDIPSPQYHWAVIGRTRGRIWVSALCFWLTKCKGLAFSWSRELYSLSGLRVMSLFLNTFVPSQFCFRHQHNLSSTPSELLLCPKCCQFKGLWLSSSVGQSFLG